MKMLLLAFLMLAQNALATVAPQVSFYRCVPKSGFAGTGFFDYINVELAGSVSRIGGSVEGRKFAGHVEVGADYVARLDTKTAFANGISVRIQPTSKGINVVVTRLIGEFAEQTVSCKAGY